MSLDDTGAPQTSRAHGGTARRSAKRTVVGILVLALALGVVGLFAIRDRAPSAGPGDCVRERVTLATAPAMADLVAAAISDVNSDEPCIDVRVSTGSVKDVIAKLSDPDAELPEIWIPDSPTWRGQLTAAGWAGTPIAEVLAQTPVALAGGPAAVAPASWADALDGGRLAMADPSADGASALALLAPYAEMSKTGASRTSIEEKTVPVAQAYGERAVAGEASDTDLETISASSTQLVPITEQAYLAARRANDELRLVTPDTGVPMLEFPLIDVNRGAADILTANGDLSARVGRAMVRWFTSRAGVEAIAAAELRGPGGEPISDAIGLGDTAVLRAVAQRTTDEALRQWRVLAVPSNLLVVMDLSGSMKTAIGGTTRIEMATQAASIGLGALPDTARVGLWGFSKNRGSGGRTWQEIAPLLPLGSLVDGRSQREVLASEARSMPSRVRGGTGVFDTIIDAYEQALADWDPAYFSTVVIFTDGASDDSSSLTTDAVVERLTNLRDPARPVRVTIVGISREADSPELQQIARATAGQSFVVTSAEEILGVLATGLLSR